MENVYFTMNLYNLGFMGGRREGALKIDGQYKLISNGKQFSLFKFGSYGNFTSFPEVKGELISEELSPNEYRYVNDASLNSRERFGGKSSDENIKLFEKATHKYKLVDKPISANIQYGDVVMDIRNNDTITVDGRHDVEYLNRDYHWKLVERPELHPEPMTLVDFIKLNESINPFENWKLVEDEPKKTKEMLFEQFTIEGKVYKVIKDYGGRQGYYITTPEEKVYYKVSNISAPFYDTIDLLTGNVRSQYDSTTDGKRYEWCYKEATHEVLSPTSIPTRFKKFTEEKSFYLNYKSTYLK